MKTHSFTALALAGALLLSTPAGAKAPDDVVGIALSDSQITVAGKQAAEDPKTAEKDGTGVYTGAEIIYYKDGTDESYGQGTEAEKHTEAEAAAHTVVTIAKPGTYRLTGSLSRGQIFVDLGEEAKDDPNAVVTLILDNVDVTCTVAPALFFYRVYECDREFVAYDKGQNPDYQASAHVDTSAAGANVVIAAGSENTFTGSHVARIYKEGTTKKLHKYDGAFYSKMSMNIFGNNGDDSGVLNIIADNEGLDSELHLTVNGGTIHIEARDDGINTNEDLVSVTTVNGGYLTVDAGRGSEGDGIDSNGFLVLNGGNLWTMSNESSPDGGIDADGAILINGGSLSAFGTRNDAADGASAQPYMELAFASTLPAGSRVELRDGSGQVVWGAVTQKRCQSITLSGSELALDTPYSLYVDDVLQCWNGNSFGMGRPGGFGGGQRPDFAPGQQPEGVQFPEGRKPGRRPEGFEGPRPDGGADLPEEMGPGERPGPRPEGEERPQGFNPGQRPQDFDPFKGQGQTDGSGSTQFVLTETIKSFSGVCDSDASGKTRVTFTVEGPRPSGRETVVDAITAVKPSPELDPASIQITVTDDPSESYAASCLLSDGLEVVNGLLPTADGDYTLTVAVVSGAEGYTGASQLSFTVGELPFVDVRSTDDGYEAIRTLYRAGVLTGTGETTFSPHMTVTRAQAVTALGRLMGAEETPGGAFADVPADAWYAGYVAWAVERGLVEGDGQGRFLPEETVTAEQMALMLKRLDKNYVNSFSFFGPLDRSQFSQMLIDIM